MQRLKKYKLVIWLALLLITGTLASVGATMFLSREMVLQQQASQTLPVVSDSLIADLQRDIEHARNLSGSLVNDAAIREWLGDQEHDNESLLAHLKAIRSGDKTLVRFVVSERDQRYLDDQGNVRNVSAEHVTDAWYAKARRSSKVIEFSLVSDPGSEAAPRLFITYRMLDADQQLIGVVGTAVPANALFANIGHRTADGSTSIYFVDQEGRVAYSDPKSNRYGNLHQQEGMASIADQLMDAQAGNHSAAYQKGSQQWLVNARPVAELGWYLIVEQNPAALVQASWVLVGANGAIGATVLVLALLLAGFAVNTHQNRLRSLASKDSMTSLMNRQSFTSSFQQAALEMRRLKLPMSFILFDIDCLKKINESHGHAIGDRIIKDIARLSRRSVRGSDLVCRWGGEQFALLLQRCELEQAYKIAEQLRLNVQNHAFAINEGESSVTISLGVAEWAEDETIDQLFGRVDEAVYLAKSEGRNRVEISYFVGV